MIRNSFAKEKEIDTRQMPLSARGKIHDVSGALFNTKIDLPSEERAAHSLPTIWAPLHIYKNACKESYPSSKLIMSYLLDLIELIFNQNNLPYKIELEEINLRPIDIEKSANNSFISALKKLNPDKNYEAYHLVYLNHDNRRELIGSTSPYTLFFLSANITETHFYQTQDTYFHKRKDLKDRNPEFVTYLGNLADQIEQISLKSNLGHKHPLNPFRTYLKSALDEAKEVLPYNKNNYGDTPFMTITGVMLFTLNDNGGIDSQYKIHPNDEREIHGALPLVLRSNLTGRYFFNYDFPIDFKISGKGIGVLPHYNYNYPWINPLVDFLEDYLVVLDYEPDDSFLYMGKNKEKNKIQKCLLPLTMKFFEYFKTEDIEKYFEIRMMSSGQEWEVKLEVPIKGGHDVLRFSKIYTETERTIDDNYGRVLKLSGKDCPFLALWPGLISDEMEDFYLLEYNRSSVKHNLIFYSEQHRETEMEANTDLSDKKLFLQELKPAKALREKAVTTFSLKKSFPDVIRMKFERDRETCSGIWAIKRRGGWERATKVMTGSENYISIDFGTTNTNVAILLAGDNEKIWEYDYAAASDKMLYYFNKTISADKKNEKRLFEEFVKMLRLYFVPLRLKQQTQYDAGDPLSAYVPFPSLLLEYMDGNISLEKKQGLCHINIPFYGEPSSSNNEFAFEFKWGDGKDYMDKYITQILMMLKAMFIKSRKNPEEVIVLVSYPMAYSKKRFQSFQSFWKTKIQEMGFKGFRFIDESQAALKYFSSMQNEAICFREDTSVVMDIGGGTTDLCVYRNGEVVCSDSMLIGGRDIVGWFGVKNEDPAKAAANPIVKFLENNVFENYDTIRNTDEYKKNFNSQLKFGYLIKHPEFLYRFYNKTIGSPQFDFVKIILSYFFCGIFYYMGLLFRDKNKFKEFPKNVYIGGNASRFLDWLVMNEWEDNVQKRDVAEIFTDAFFSGCRLEDTAEKEKFRFTIKKSVEPKSEVALGLIQGKDQMNTFNSGMKDDFEFRSYKYSIFGENLRKGDIEKQTSDVLSYEAEDFNRHEFKIEENEVNGIEYANVKKSELYLYNSRFVDYLLNRQLLKPEEGSLITGDFENGCIATLKDDSGYVPILRREINGHIKDVGSEIGTSFFILGLKGFVHKIVEITGKKLFPLKG